MGVPYSVKHSLLPLQEVISQPLRVGFVDSSGGLADSPDSDGRNAVAREVCSMSHL